MPAVSDFSRVFLEVQPYVAQKVPNPFGRRPVPQHCNQCLRFSLLETTYGVLMSQTRRFYRAPVNSRVHTSGTSGAPVDPFDTVSVFADKSHAKHAASNEDHNVYPRALEM